MGAGELGWRRTRDDRFGKLCNLEEILVGGSSDVGRCVWLRLFVVAVQGGKP